MYCAFCQKYMGLLCLSYFCEFCSNLRRVVLLYGNNTVDKVLYEKLGVSIIKQLEQKKTIEEEKKTIEEEKKTVEEEKKTIKEQEKPKEQEKTEINNLKRQHKQVSLTLGTE